MVSNSGTNDLCKMDGSISLRRCESVDASLPASTWPTYHLSLMLVMLHFPARASPKRMCMQGSWDRKRAWLRHASLRRLNRAPAAAAMLPRTHRPAFPQAASAQKHCAFSRRTRMRIHSLGASATRFCDDYVSSSYVGEQGRAALQPCNLCNYIGSPRGRGRRIGNKRRGLPHSPRNAPTPTRTPRRPTQASTIHPYFAAESASLFLISFICAIIYYIFIDVYIIDRSHNVSVRAEYPPYQRPSHAP